MKNKIDYSPYLLEAEQKLKEAHDLLKVRQHMDALKALDEATVALRMMRTAVISHVE